MALAARTAVRLPADQGTNMISAQDTTRQLGDQIYNVSSIDELRQIIFDVRTGRANGGRGRWTERFSSPGFLLGPPADSGKTAAGKVPDRRGIAPTLPPAEGRASRWPWAQSLPGDSQELA